MRLPEIDFSSLEIREIGAWPLILRIPVVISAVVVALTIAFFLIFETQFVVLEDNLKKLDDKKKEFQNQYNQAINLDAYKAQMKDMQAIYEQYVRELPSSSNIPELIDSITKLGEKNGLRFNFIKIGDPKLTSGFYMTLPLTISITGTYHNCGLFVSDVSQLARIVTIGDFSIKAVTGSDNAQKAAGLLDVTLDSQTYWLATASELQQQKTIDTKPVKGKAAPKGAVKPGATRAPGTDATLTPPGSSDASSSDVPASGDQQNMPIPTGRPSKVPPPTPAGGG